MARSPEPLERGTVIGKSVHEVFPAEQADRFLASDRAAMACDGVYDVPAPVSG